MDIDIAIRHLTVLHPGFPDSIEGATEAEIDLLQDLVQRPLPASYRRFLARLGRRDGGLSLDTMFDFRIDSLIAHYQDAAWGVEPPLLLIGLFPTDGMAVLPMCLDGADTVDPDVVLPTLKEGVQTEVSRCAESLGEMVFRLGFAEFFAFKLAFEGNAQRMAPDAESMRKLEAVVLSEGLTRHPASGGFSRYFLRPDLCVEVVHAPEHDRAAITVHGQEEAAVEALLARLEREAGTVTWGLQPTVDAHSHLESDDDDDASLDEEDEDEDEADDDET